jgi:uncharacterized phage protein gp47/JayE
MSFSRPSLQELIIAFESELESRLLANQTILPASDMVVLSRVVAGATHGLYGFLSWISRQIIPDTADEEELLRAADWWGVPRKSPSTASGTVTVSGSNDVIVPAGTLWQRLDGQQYETTAEVTVVLGTALLPVVALLPGESGNAGVSTALKLVSPISGLSGTASVTVGGLGGGSDVETLDQLRIRLRERVQSPPNGGSSNDYRQWAKGITGVTRAWPYPRLAGPGTVGLTFVCDDQSGTIIPDSGKVAEVQAYLSDPMRCPPGCVVSVFAPTAVPLNLTISGLSPSTAAVKEAVVANIRALLKREAEPGQTLLITHVREAISSAAGEYDHALVSPAANITHAVGEIAVMGVVTWI